MHFYAVTEKLFLQTSPSLNDSMWRTKEMGICYTWLLNDYFISILKYKLSIVYSMR